MLTLICDLDWENISSLLSELILEKLCAGMCILSGEISGQARREERRKGHCQGRPDPEWSPLIGPDPPRYCPLVG